MKKLPLTEQPFRNIISEDRLYADKTDYIFEMIKKYKSCFLSRPRRFGKTLLLDTIEELFSGDKELFKGLKIASLGYEFKKHPVIRLKLNYTKTGSPEDLEKNIITNLMSVAKAEGIPLEVKFYDRLLGEFLMKLSKKYGAGVVFLVDEYDAPVSKHFGNITLAEANASILHGFYTALKNNINYLHFVFVTGITRFTLANMDVGPNNFQDLSLDPRYAGSCGFTISEFDSLFQDRMPQMLESLKAKGQISLKANEATLRKKIGIIRKCVDLDVKGA